MEKNIPKVCLLSYADGVYLQAKNRLLESVNYFHPEWEQIVETTLPKNCPGQNTSPMAFKPYLFDQARKEGKEIVIWLDSVCVLVRRAQFILKALKRHGCYFWTSYTPTGEWCSDWVLESTGMTRERSFEVPELTTCVVGLDFRKSAAQQFLDEWLRLANDGVSFRGIPLDDRPWTDVIWNTDGCVSSDPRVKGHRYDQTVGSLLTEKQDLFRTGLGTFDIQQVIPSKIDPDRKPFIPFDVSVVQNRDMKNGRGMSFAEHLPYLRSHVMLAFFALLKRIVKQVFFRLGLRRIW